MSPRKKRQSVELDPVGGGCPRRGCSRHDGRLNISTHHWYYCDKHKTKWLVGWEMFDDWQREDPEIWKANEAKLAGYKSVIPRLTPEALAAQGELLRKFGESLWAKLGSDSTPKPPPMIFVKPRRPTIA